jgi:diguanylate cyclase (GGDEF)-like protein
VNDHHGHAAGDLVLQEVAHRLDALKREYDLLGRLGGDEFVFVLPQTTAEAARPFGARILAAIAEPAFPLIGGNTARLTGSVGIAMFPTDAQGARDLLAAADRAMYAAKTGGRNRCTMAAEIPVPQR